jgi:hypothetical protein
MRYRKLLGLCLMIGCLAGGVLSRAVPAERVNLNGQVTLESQSRPPRFYARLYFPKETGRQPLLTVTDNEGRFSFTDLDDGRYLLELHEGDQLVYQRVITLPQDQRVDIRLRAR